MNLVCNLVQQVKVSGGERPEGSGVYYSYIRDLDGNKICAFTNNK